MSTTVLSVCAVCMRVYACALCTHDTGNLCKNLNHLYSSDYATVILHSIKTASGRPNQNFDVWQLKNALFFSENVFTHTVLQHTCLRYIPQDIYMEMNIWYFRQREGECFKGHTSLPPFPSLATACCGLWGRKWLGLLWTVLTESITQEALSKSVTAWRAAVRYPSLPHIAEQYHVLERSVS